MDRDSSSPELNATPANVKSNLLSALKQGVDNWNQYRRNNPGMLPDLSEVQLDGQDLTGVKFNSVRLNKTSLKGTILNEANLQEAVLTEADMEGARLVNAYLDGAEMERAVLKHADLSDTVLNKAKLTGANLQWARFDSATGLTKDQLQQASNWKLAFYSETQLEQFGLTRDHNERISKKDFNLLNFQDADLRGADFSGADLSRANLRVANLWGANMCGAKIEEADLFDANLEWANFAQATHLTPEQLRQARNWPLAMYDPEICQKLELRREHNKLISQRDLRGAQLREVNLRGADLSKFKLQGANLQAANLEDAKLGEANLQKSDFRKAHGLTVEQLKTGLNWPLALYDPRIITSLGLSPGHNIRVETQNLSDVNLAEMPLVESLLVGFNFQRARLCQADLRRSDLSNAQLAGADLREARLEEANLQGAELQSADLQGALLRGATGLSKEQLHRAKNWVLAFYSDEIRNILGTPLLDSDINAKKFDGLNFNDADLHEADLEKATFLNTELNRANLRGSNLKDTIFTDAKLCEADLRGADFSGADLQQADLTGADLRGATLVGAKLGNAILRGALLRDANLQNAGMETARGLLGGQLAATNVSGAALPTDIKEFKGLASIDESSKNASNIFIAILAACLYALLTIASTKDADLLTNSASSPLPIVQTAIPIVGFYAVAPLLLFAIYIYFHLSLQRLWEQLADQPAIFPDGKPLDKRAYPWLLNGLVQSKFKQLSQNRPALSRLQASISFMLAWWLVPATLLFFWLRYLPRQDWKWTLLHIALLAVAVTSAAALPQLAAKTLKGETISKFSLRHAFQERRTFTYLLLPLLSAAVFFVISFKIFDRTHAVLCGDMSLGQANQPMNLNWAQRAFSFVRYPFAELVETNVSTKPANWTGQNKDEIALVKGADLKGRNLRYVAAVRAFLVNADLREADLQGADLREADLRNANLSSAILVDSCLNKADLSGANLRGAQLAKAELSQADLFGANLEGAILQATDIKAARNWFFAFYDPLTLVVLNLRPDHNSRVQQKNLSEYNFEGVEFSGGDLRDFNLSKAHLLQAKFDNANLKGANLQQANLREASLVGAHLEKATLIGANLENANLTGTHLEGADLTDVTGLTPEQVRTSIVDETTRLPRSIETVGPMRGKKNSLPK